MNRRNALFFALATALVVGNSQPNALAWDEDGHAIVTHLAIDALPPDMPEWLRTPEVRTRLAYLSSEPDRWRGQDEPVLNHINGPDHYIDEEKLTPYGLSLKNLPKFRNEFIDIMATQRARNPEKFNIKPDPKHPDKDYTQLNPGVLPYRIAELEWKLAAGWTQLKTYEAHRDKVSEATIQNARENIIYTMGILSHYVGDGAQPLHLTEHHHGWVGANPKGFTTDSKFHAYIDGGVIDLHHISYDSLKERAKPFRTIDPKNYWPDVCGYLYETFEEVEPLYELEKSGELKQAKGKAFIENRLREGGAALAGVWTAGYRAAKIDEFRVKRLMSSDGHEPGRAPANQKPEARKAAIAR